jgi:hypothetical protein
MSSRRVGDCCRYRDIPMRVQPTSGITHGGRAAVAERSRPRDASIIESRSVCRDGAGPLKDHLSVGFSYSGLSARATCIDHCSSCSLSVWHGSLTVYQGLGEPGPSWQSGWVRARALPSIRHAPPATPHRLSIRSRSSVATGGGGPCRILDRPLPATAAGDPGAGHPARTAPFRGRHAAFPVRPHNSGQESKCYPDPATSFR